MSRRPFVLIALSLVALSLSACSDVTAPTSSAPRQIQSAGQPSNDVIVCPGGTLSSSGRC
jgi:hypothetical protein